MTPIQGNRNEHGRNASGYSDPTMTGAVDKISKDRKRMEKLVQHIYYICELAGFEVGERIVLVDKTTGEDLEVNMLKVVDERKPSLTPFETLKAGDIFIIGNDINRIYMKLDDIYEVSHGDRPNFKANAVEIAGAYVGTLVEIIPRVFVHITKLDGDLVIKK